MKRLFKVFMIAAMVVFLSGSAFGWNSADHVKVAPNGKGDVLIFPFYIADGGGYETQVTVVNTDPVRSVVAKLIVRSGVRSEELIDFFLYLTHNDVWTGTIRIGDQGVEIYSEDDSALISKDPVTWASAANPMEVSFGVDPFGLECTGDSANYGYITVITAWWTDLTQVTRPATEPTWTSQWPWDDGANDQPASKDFLYWAYGGDDGNTKLLADTWGCYNTNDNATNANSALLPCFRINVLTGYMQLNNLASGMETVSALRATTLRDYGNRDYLTLATETILGFEDSADNVIEEVGAALAKNNLAMPLINTVWEEEIPETAAHIFTFPTKFHYRWFNCAAYNVNDNGWVAPVAPGDQTPGNAPPDSGDWFWNWNATDGPAPTPFGCVAYQQTHYNMEELTQVEVGGPYSGVENQPDEIDYACEEVTIVTNDPMLSRGDFPRGWYRYAFLNRDEQSPPVTPLFSNRQIGYDFFGEDNYTGVPVIATAVKIEENFKFGLMYGAWDDGNVSNPAINTIYPDYQYSDDWPKVNPNTTPIP